MAELQSLSRTIAGLQQRLGQIDRERAQADRNMATCQLQINKLRNIQATARNQSPQGAQRLRRDLTEWENRFRTARTRYANLTQSMEITRNQRRQAQARLEQLQQERARRMAMAGGGGHMGGRRRY